MQQADASTGSPLSTDALLAQGAKLSDATLKEAESEALAADKLGTPTNLDQLVPDEPAPKSAYTSGAVRQKAADKLVPVWRFYNSATGAHFFTRSATERDNVLTNLSPPKGSFQYEGEAFKVANAPSPGLSPVHRFYNTQTGVHFYTISDTERTHITTNLLQFTYEGIAYWASKVNGAGMAPFYRFYLPAKGFHFYTASQQERDNITANLAAIYQYEGPGYSVLESNWQPQPEPPAVIPHSGVQNTQCVSGTFGSLGLCSDANAIALNPQQDGHRAAINPMSFSNVGAYPVTSCVKDNVTGLIWEGKTSDGGPRNGTKTFTNYSNDRADDASGYAAYVNGLNLCGYNDWRLPTQQELLSIVNYGRYEPALDTTWFPNSNYTYWTAEKRGKDSRYLATVTFNEGYTGSARVGYHRIKLVRGYGHTTQRYSYATVAYGLDAANNVVVDAWTGLRWRRCEQGRSWSGLACTGTASTFTHSDALAHARDQSGWRLPNVKELASLVDLSVTSGATIDPTAFPAALAETVWSSTPYVLGKAQFVVFADGFVYYNYGSFALRVRLVQLTP